MIEVPVLNIEGKEVGKFSVDEALLGTVVRPALLKQAVADGHEIHQHSTTHVCAENGTPRTASSSPLPMAELRSRTFTGAGTSART